MITVLTGENSFERHRALQRIVADFDGTAERIDGADIDTGQVADLFMGATLFSSRRLVIIDHLSDNKPVWNELPTWLPRVGDDTHVVLVETKPDKRTKTYKDIIKIADVMEFPAWSDRDIATAQRWVAAEAKSLGVSLDTKSAQALVGRVGSDQWQLYHALEKLAVMDEITPHVITELIEPHPSENVFNLLDAALRGDRRRVADMLRTLEHTDDPYMVFGLLSSQVMQLAALAVSELPPGEVAKGIGAHPFALSKLAPHSHGLGRAGAKRIVGVFADADRAIKTTAIDPWIQIERALMSITAAK